MVLSSLWTSAVNHTPLGETGLSSPSFPCLALSASWALACSVCLHGQIHVTPCWKLGFLFDPESHPQNPNARFSSVFCLPFTPVEAGNPCQTRNSGVPQRPHLQGCRPWSPLFSPLEIPLSGSVDAGSPRASPFKLQSRELSGCDPGQSLTSGRSHELCLHPSAPQGGRFLSLAQ